jgi:hypothetical protein
MGVVARESMFWATVKVAAVTCALTLATGVRSLLGQETVVKPPVAGHQDSVLQITDWRNSKTSDQEVVLLVNQGEDVAFSVHTNLPPERYSWLVNQQVQDNHASTFKWRVPGEKKVWNISVEARASGLPVLGTDPSRFAWKRWTVTTTKVNTVKPGESIQAALDALPPEGGVVRLGEGQFPISAPVLISKSNVALRGTGMDKTSLDGRSAAFDKIVVHDTLNSNAYQVELANITIADLHLVGGNRRGEGNGIFFIHARDSQVFSVDIEKVDKGVMLKNVYNTEVAYSHVHHCGWSCVEHMMAQKIWVHHNTLNDATEVLEFNRLNKQDQQRYPNSDGLVEYNSIYNGVCHCIYLYSASSNITVRNNEIWKGRDACIGIVESSNHKIHGNVIREAYGDPAMKRGDGIGFGLSSSGVEIRNNAIFGNNGCGIGFRDFHLPATTRGCRVISNTICGNNKDGIYGSDPKSDLKKITIRGNLIVSNKGYGVSFSNPKSVEVAYNNLWGNAVGNCQGLAAGAGDVSVDPLCADPANGDFHLRSKAGRWDAKAKQWVKDDVHSPCIDAGDPKAEFKEETSPNGGRIDMGSYGNTPDASRSENSSGQQPDPGGK